MYRYLSYRVSPFNTLRHAYLVGSADAQKRIVSIYLYIQYIQYVYS